MAYVCKCGSGDLSQWRQTGRSYTNTTRLCLNETVKQVRIKKPGRQNDRAFLLVLLQSESVINDKTSDEKKRKVSDEIINECIYDQVHNCFIRK